MRGMFPTLKQRLDKSENTRYGPFNTHRWNRWPLCVFVCAQMIIHMHSEN